MIITKNAFKILTLTVISMLIIVYYSNFTITYSEKNVFTFFLNFNKSSSDPRISQSIHAYSSNVIHSVSYDSNSLCPVEKIEFNNTYALDLQIKINKNSAFTCDGVGEIAPNNHIIQVEENVPDLYDGSKTLETYTFRLKENRLKYIYGLNYSSVKCYMTNISKKEGRNEGDSLFFSFTFSTDRVNKA